MKTSLAISLLNFSLLIFNCSSAYSQPIAVGAYHSLFVCADSTASTCGGNSYGQLGDGTTIDKSTPVQINGLTNITAVAGGGYYSLFLKSNGTVWACGYNNKGQLGDGTNIDKSTPVQVIPTWIGNIVAVASGYDHSLFVKFDGTVWSCGNNNSGQLGDGTMSSKSNAVQVNGLTNIIAVDCGANHSIFLKNDGTVWACGNNNMGQLGDGTTINKLNPVQISGLTGIISITGGVNHSLFLKNDGTVWACGNNSNGQLGDGTTSSKSTAVQVSAVWNGSITAIAGGSAHSLFMKSNGTIWACGLNFHGELGDGTNTDKSTPVQASALTDITTVTSGWFHSLYLKNDFTVWACGKNDASQLGDGTTINKLTPTPISGLCSVVSIEENSITNNISIYPNPCNEEISIELTNEFSIQLFDKNIIAEILTIQGQLLQSILLQSPKTIIQINNLTSGLYFVKVKSQQGIIVKKIVKN